MTTSERCELCMIRYHWATCQLKPKSQEECIRHYAEAKGGIWAPKIIAGAKPIGE